MAISFAFMCSKIWLKHKAMELRFLHQKTAKYKHFIICFIYGHHFILKLNEYNIHMYNISYLIIQLQHMEIYGVCNGHIGGAIS